jgi:hypothetical protein
MSLTLHPEFFVSIFVRRFQPFEERVAEIVSRQAALREAQAVGGEFPVRDQAGNEVEAGVSTPGFCLIRATLLPQSGLLLGRRNGGDQNASPYFRSTGVRRKTPASRAGWAKGGHETPKSPVNLLVTILNTCQNFGMNR